MKANTCQTCDPPNAVGLCLKPYNCMGAIMPRKRTALDEIDKARSEAARKIHVAQSNLHNLRTGIEEDALDKTVMLRLIKEAEDALQEVETF